MRDDDVVGETGADHDIGRDDAAFQQKRGPEHAAGLLVIGEMQLDGAGVGRPGRQQRLERKGIRRKTDFDTATPRPYMTPSITAAP